MVLYLGRVTLMLGVRNAVVEVPVIVWLDTPTPEKQYRCFVTTLNSLKTSGIHYGLMLYNKHFTSLVIYVYTRSAMKLKRVHDPKQLSLWQDIVLVTFQIYTT